MDYKQAFVYVFEDKNWLGKILIGGLLSLGIVFIVPGMFVAGYYIQVIRQVMRGELSGLPEWDDWGELLSTGFRYWVVIFLYGLPFLLLGGLLFLVTFFPAFISGLSGEEELAGGAAVFTVIGQLVFQVFSFIVPILFAFWLPSVAIRFAATDDVKACFDFCELWEFIRKDVGNYLIVVILIWALGYFAGIGMILCCVGVLFTAFYAQLVGAHLQGQLYLQQQSSL